MATPLEQTLRAALIADPGVNPLLGSNIFLVQIPENPTYPVCAIERVSTVPLYVQQLDSTQASGGWVRFQITVWASSATSGHDVDTIALAILSALRGFNLWQPTGDPLRNAPNYMLNRRMGVEPQTSPPLYKAIMDVRFFYRDQ